MTSAGHRPGLSVAASQTLDAAVWSALGTVRDPELDEPITDLGFVTSATVTCGVAHVRLVLPTYFCAPNFAYLMVADAYDAVAEVRGVHTVDIALEDHFAAAEINAGVAAGAGFDGSFPGDTEPGGAEADLTDLRRTFQRKAHTACLERACRRLVADGWEVEALGGVRLADLPESAERRSLLRRRDDLGIPTGPGDPLLVDDEGTPVPADRLAAHLRFAQAVRVSIEGNSSFCRGLLHTRYPELRDRLGDGPVGEDGVR
ncbi:MAG TPA: iron-sulfur cluster assembly protein [Mycobacteriales bacterium]|jgi:metal-sulfur cluster biosynthetic enzyme